MSRNEEKLEDDYEDTIARSYSYKIVEVHNYGETWRSVYTRI